MEGLAFGVPVWGIRAVAAVFGAMWGSFANVVIARWPEGMSVVRPASRCPHCLAPIRWYDNVPILSFIALKGRCRNCGKVISPRYPVVEAALALLSVAAVEITLLATPAEPLAGLSRYFVTFAFLWALVTAAMIDLETYLLPDAITLPGIVIGFPAGVFLMGRDWLDLLVAAAGGFAAIHLLFVWLYRRLTGGPGMGEGDAKLVAMIGAFLGVRGALFSLFAGAIQGLVVGSILVILRRRAGVAPVTLEPGEIPDPRFRKARVPFGPFLALGAIEHVFVGGIVIDAYASAVARLLASM